MSQDNRRVLALAGGVGGAKLALGLSAVLPADALTVAVNTADDFEHLGLSISPDLDTVTVIPLDSYYGLAPKPEAPPSDVKVSAAWLIEHAGIGKGFRLPRSRAGVSTKHALALTNRGGATAGEIAELARFIQSRVHAEFGLVLQPEPVLVDVEL